MPPDAEFSQYSRRGDAESLSRMLLSHSDVSDAHRGSFWGFPHQHLGDRTRDLGELCPNDLFRNSKV